MNSLRLILSDRKFFAPAWVFASLNIITGTWVLYLPHVKSKFGLDDAQIGIALFCLALGLLISIPFIPYINKKYGVGRCTKYGILLFALSYNLPLLAPSYIMLCAALLLTGVFSGFTDVSMNSLVSYMEKNSNEHFMSAAHGFFSLGGFIGAGVGSILMLVFSIPIWHMLVISVFIFITNLYLSTFYFSTKENLAQESDSTWSWRTVWPLWSLALVAFIIMINEGAVENWSNLFFTDVIQISQNKAGFGFITFSLCMTIGRFFGDGISKKFGSVFIMIASCIIALLGYTLILSSLFYTSIIGFGVVGLGLSIVIPEIFRLAGNTEGVEASVGISIVSGIGFVGFLLGPVILGFISYELSLIWSFIFLSALVLVALIIIALVLRKTYANNS